MENNTFTALEDTAKANQILAEAIAEPVYEEPAQIIAPSDTTVNLPGGYMTFTGEVYRTAEVRELNGRDEEIIAKAGVGSKMFSAILSRGTVSVGEKPADDRLLDNLLIGDREAILLGIYKATFGPTAKVYSWCAGCKETKDIQIDIDKDIKTKILVDPVGDREFTVKGKKNEYSVTLPTGVAEKAISADPNKNYAEKVTILLENTVVSINGSPVVSKSQIQNLGLQDRNKISEELASRNSGPIFDDIVMVCPDCDGEIVVPVNLGAIFRL
jgi:hypothetical protein